MNGVRSDQMIKNALESTLVARSVQTDVPGVVSVSHVGEFANESAGVLA